MKSISKFILIILLLFTHNSLFGNKILYTLQDFFDMTHPSKKKAVVVCSFALASTIFFSWHILQQYGHLKENTNNAYRHRILHMNANDDITNDHHMKGFKRKRKGFIISLISCTLAAAMCSLLIKSLWKDIVKD